MPPRKPFEPFPHGDPRNLYHEFSPSRRKEERKRLPPIHPWHPLIPSTERRIKRFTLNLRELSEKKARVLDVGSSTDDFIYRLIERSNGNIHGTAIDAKLPEGFSEAYPEIYLKKTFTEFHSGHSKKESEKFDLIIANQSLPLYSESRQAKAADVLKMLELTAVNGEVKFYPAEPLFELGKGAYDEQRIFREIIGAGFEVKIFDDPLQIISSSGKILRVASIKRTEKADLKKLEDSLRAAGFI